MIASMSCKKSEDTSQTPAVPFTAVVSFGDSLSDAGTYQVGAIKAAGGGLFTVNGIGSEPGSNPVPSYTWSQLVSAAVLGRTSCAARVGGFGSPVSLLLSSAVTLRLAGVMSAVVIAVPLTP